MAIKMVSQKAGCLGLDSTVAGAGGRHGAGCAVDEFPAVDIVGTGRLSWRWAVGLQRSCSTSCRCPPDQSRWPAVVICSEMKRKERPSLYIPDIYQRLDQMTRT
jgi:hypothetical protein